MTIDDREYVMPENGRTNGQSGVEARNRKLTHGTICVGYHIAHPFERIVALTNPGDRTTLPISSPASNIVKLGQLCVSRVNLCIMTDSATCD